MSESDWDAVGYVRSSSYRSVVLRQLENGPRTPTEIVDAVEDVKIAHVSRALTELREKDMVELKVSEDVRKGRIYGITDKGKGVVDHLLENNE